MNTMLRLGLFIVGLVIPVAMSAQSSGAGGAAAGEVTFAKDIAPILQRSCQQCHRPASVAPMSLLTYEEVRPWARSIKMRTGLRNKRGAMPPWFIEKDIGIQHFKDDPSLTEEEIKKVAVWADSGAPLGNPADLPPPLDFGNEDDWAIGEPDLILETPEVVVAAAAPDKWTSLGTVPMGLTEDRYAAAVEVREFNDVPEDLSNDTVGGRFVFHHLTYGIVVPEDADYERTRWPTHEVGRNADFFAPGTGYQLPAGSSLDLNNTHLHSNGRETRAHLRFAFKLHPRGYEPTMKYRDVFVGNGVDIDVKPLQADQELHAYTVLNQHTKLLAFEPHLHAAGSRMCLQAIWGGNVHTLSCTGYDHGWVKQYTYADDYAPLLPKGTILHVIGWADTTPANSNYADPRNWSGGGRRSISNMFNMIGPAIVLTDEELEREMAERRERLELKKNDYLIGCPLCQVEFPSQVTSTNDQQDN